MNIVEQMLIDQTVASVENNKSAASGFWV